MAPIKSILISLALTMAALQATFATPLVGDVGYGDYGLDSNLAYDSTGSSGYSTSDVTAKHFVPEHDKCETHVPVPPTTIAPETNFLPISNVWPKVNIFPVDVNDYSCPRIYHDGDYDGNYGSGYGGGYESDYSDDSYGGYDGYNSNDYGGNDYGYGDYCNYGCDGYDNSGYGGLGSYGYGNNDNGY
ncbi:hypothetical protein BGX27_004725 [Mortierella sp. AM989]|nr:hypothetical protein BGX27_004725 [Mortierella sp. AM989]